MNGNSYSQFPDLGKLWERCRLAYNSVELIGDQLKSNYDSFSASYHNMCRYYSKFSNRNPTEMHDVVAITNQKLNINSATSQLFLQEIDFKNAERLVQIFNSLQELHNFLTGDVMKILARDHSKYFDQSNHSRRFNKVLRSMHDVRLALQSLNNDDGQGASFKSDSSLPPHEKMWYLFCLVERESLAVCSILESVGTWERDMEERFFPPITAKKCRNEEMIKKSKLVKNEARPIVEESWESNLRKYKKPIHVEKKVISAAEEAVIDSDSRDEFFVNENLRINKWNLREPLQTSRSLKPKYNKSFSLRYKNAVSKPHCSIKPYFSKVSVGSEMSHHDANSTFLGVDARSGRRVRMLTNEPQEYPRKIIELNTKLASLEEVVNQLITDRQHLERRIIDPLRKQVEQGLEWLRTLYSTKTNAIETTQEKINQLKMEKSLYCRENHKLHHGKR